MVLCLDVFFSLSKVSAKSGARRSSGQKILIFGMFLLASLGLGIMTACGGGAPGQTLGSTPPIQSQPSVETCNEPGHILPAGNVTAPTDLQINGVNCIVDGSGTADSVTGAYVYRNVNIWNGGTLTFEDAPIDFHAHSILVEAGGTLQAGSGNGLNGPLTIWLWGSAGDGIPSITCQSGQTCGVAADVWASNPSMAQGMVPTTPCSPATNYPDNNVPTSDCFYQYSPLEPKNPTPNAYFGSKVLAVSAGGTLELMGAKGVRTGEPIETNPADSGTSWARLTQTLAPSATSFTIDRPVPTWAAGDLIAMTTTDYLPSHTEELTIQSVANTATDATITVTSGVQYPHSGVAYDYSAVAAAHTSTGPLPDPAVTNLLPNHVETRAIVALLSRDIVVASEGATPTYSRTADHFPTTVGNYYGGSTIVRQGFKTYQVQGVEFHQLGQGGVISHYPVHFHMARSVPQPNGMGFDGTYIADSSVVDSMTRFITLHATQGVTLARNVGYKSIGHGFYLEDATETNNRLYSDVAISVQGALADAATNPRMVPGILDLNDGTAGQQIQDNPPFDTDVTNPAAFWITNTWNDFEYNAAVGVGACGACYWMPPSGISGPSRDETWQGYAGMQKNPGLYGGVPLQKFWGNSCSAAMNSINTVGQTSPCFGIEYGTAGASTPSSTSTQLVSVVNSAPNALPMGGYPVEALGLRAKATLCDSSNHADCSLAPPCTGINGNEADCMATVIEHYTTSFNWAQTNFAAIWLRGWWYLVDNSAITDVQNGGLTFISGGGYSRSDAAQGFWSVLKNSVLVGNTQPIASGSDVPVNPFASNGGPSNPSGITCAYNPQDCVSLADGISFQGSGFAVNQRLFSIYDGPANQYNNIYADIQPTVLGTLGGCKPGGGNPNGNCVTLGWFNAYNFGVLQSPTGNSQSNNCILPNAAIAWKQPNGFYYPPAFNSNNLAFSNVGIRHFVIEPLYLSGGFKDDTATIKNTYCTWDHGMFSSSFTDIDRQTELTDNDASLTGLTSSTSGTAGPTVSVTKADFYNAPLVTDQCASGQSASAPAANDAGATASTSPYQYLTTAIIAQCAVGNACPNHWADVCSSTNCYGVPLYRQTVTQPELTAITNAPNDLTKRPSIHMMGEDNAQRSALTLNHGQYYLDTTLSGATQLARPQDANGFPPAVQFVNVFQPGQTYTVFFLFAKQTTQQTYSLYVGTGLSNATAKALVVPARVAIPSDNFQTTPSPSGIWATFGGYDSTTGILTVNVNMSGLAGLMPQNQAAYCQPTTYCSWNSSTSSCGCKAGSGCTDNQVCSYATKDIDCPADGCYGFSITMPSGFQTAAAGSPILPPAPILFTTADPYFSPGGTIFAAGTQTVAGACTYTTTPTQP